MYANTLYLSPPLRLSHSLRYLYVFFFFFFLSFYLFNFFAFGNLIFILKDTHQASVLGTHAVIYAVRYTVMAVCHVTNGITAHTHKKPHTFTVICAHSHRDDPTIFAHTCVPNIKLYNNLWTH